MPLSPRLLADRAGDVVAVHAGEADVEQDRRRDETPRQCRAPRGRRARCVPRCRAAGGARRNRPPRRGSRPRRGSAAKARRAPQRRGTAADSRPAGDPLPEGSRTTKSLPMPGPPLRATIDAAVHLHEAPRQGQADAQPPWERSRDRSTCVNMSKIRGSISAGMPMPVSRTRDDRLPPVPLAPSSQMRPPRCGVLRGVVEQVRDDLRQPRQVAVQEDRLARRASTRSSWPHASMSGRLVSTAACRTSASSMRLLAQLELVAGDARQMSRRSSMRRVICCIWRSMTSSAHRSSGPEDA